MIVTSYSGHRLVLASKRRHRFTTGNLFPKAGVFDTITIDRNAAFVFMLAARDNGGAGGVSYLYPLFYSLHVLDCIDITNRMQSWGAPFPLGFEGRAWNEYYAQFVGDKMTDAQLRVWETGMQSVTDARKTLCVPLLPGYP
jgi:hypothetical protein